VNTVGRGQEFVLDAADYPEAAPGPDDRGRRNGPRQGRCARPSSRRLVQEEHRALLRRFDSVVKYALPTPAVALQILTNRLALLNTAPVKWSVVARSARKLSQAELARACENAVKQAVMARRTSLTTAEIVQALQERRASQSPSPSRRPVAVEPNS